MNDANCLANKIKHTRKAPQHVKLKTPQHFKLEAGIVCSNCHVILNENGRGCPRQQKKSVLQCLLQSLLPAELRKDSSRRERGKRDSSQDSENGRGCPRQQKRVSLCNDSRRRSMESLQKRIQSLQSLLQRRIQEELVGRLQSLLQSLLPPENRFGLTRLPTAGADRAPMF